RGLAAFVYPARSLSSLLAGATARGLAAKRIRFVHARASDPARVALVELRRGREGGLVVEPPLVEWDASGARSPEVAELVEGRLTPGFAERQTPSNRSR
ncbi:MAG: methyltransferase, partial [Deltaproteobacteria bacterium]|nr:methyltransferase [Deltaproteobacteria bacterium]